MRTACILPFRRPASDASAETVAAALLALEASPLFAPVVAVARNLFGGWQINLVVDGRGLTLNPAEARLAARALCDDPGQPGGLETAARLRDAADLADARTLRGAA